MKTHTHTDSLAQYPDRVISPKAFHGIFLSPLKSHFNPCVCFDLLHGSSSMSRVKTKKAIRIECTTCARVRVCVCVRFQEASVGIGKRMQDTHTAFCAHHRLQSILVRLLYRNWAGLLSLAGLITGTASTLRGESATRQKLYFICHEF